MTRRQALLATALVAGAYVGQAKPAGGQFDEKTGKWKPGHLTFDLATFDQYQFTLGKESLTFTPAELMAALTPCQHEAQSWGGLEFHVGSRRLDVCRKCGQTYWRNEK